MEKNVSSALQRFATALNQFFPALAKDLDCHIRRNASLVDEAAAEVELDLRSGRESDFDLLKTDLCQQVEEAEFLMDVHRLGQGLIAVPEVDAAPDRGSLDYSIGPLPVRQKARVKRTIFCSGRRVHKRNCSRKIVKCAVAELIRSELPPPQAIPTRKKITG